MDLLKVPEVRHFSTQCGTPDFERLFRVVFNCNTGFLRDKSVGIFPLCEPYWVFLKEKFIIVDSKSEVELFLLHSFSIYSFFLNLNVDELLDKIEHLNDPDTIIFKNMMLNFIEKVDAVFNNYTAVSNAYEYITIDPYPPLKSMTNLALQNVYMPCSKGFFIQCLFDIELNEGHCCTMNILKTLVDNDLVPFEVFDSYKHTKFNLDGFCVFLKKYIKYTNWILLVYVKDKFLKYYERRNRGKKKPLLFCFDEFGNIKLTDKSIIIQGQDSRINIKLHGFGYIEKTVKETVFKPIMKKREVFKNLYKKVIKTRLDPEHQPCNDCSNGGKKKLAGCNHFSMCKPCQQDGVLNPCLMRQKFSKKLDEVEYTEDVFDKTITVEIEFDTGEREAILIEKVIKIPLNYVLFSRLLPLTEYSKCIRFLPLWSIIFRVNNSIIKKLKLSSINDILEYDKTSNVKGKKFNKNTKEIKISKEKTNALKPSKKTPEAEISSPKESAEIIFLKKEMVKYLHWIEDSQEQQRKLADDLERDFTEETFNKTQICMDETIRVMRHIMTLHKRYEELCSKVGLKIVENEAITEIKRRLAFNEQYEDKRQKNLRNAKIIFNNKDDNLKDIESTKIVSKEGVQGGIVKKNVNDNKKRRKGEKSDYTRVDNTGTYEKKITHEKKIEKININVLRDLFFLTSYSNCVSLLPLWSVIFKRNNLLIKKLKINTRIDVLRIDWSEEKSLKQLRKTKCNLTHVSTKETPHFSLGLNKKRLKKTNNNLEIDHIKYIDYLDKKIKLYEGYNKIDKERLKEWFRITYIDISMKKMGYSMEDAKIPKNKKYKINIEENNKYLKALYTRKQECIKIFDEKMKQLFFEKLPKVEFKHMGVYVNLEENLQKKIGEMEYNKEMRNLKCMTVEQRQSLKKSSSDIISLCKDYATNVYARVSMILYLSKKFPQLNNHDLESIATKDPKNYIDGRTFNWQILMNDMASEIESILEQHMNKKLIIKSNFEEMLKIEENKMTESEIESKNIFIRNLCLNNKISIENIGIFKNIDLSFLKKLTDNELLDYFSTTREDVVKLIQLGELLNLFKFTMLNEEYKKVFFPLNEDFPPPVPPPKGIVKPSPREDMSLDN
jgi:hypothetical protein